MGIRTKKISIGLLTIILLITIIQSLSQRKITDELVFVPRTVENLTNKYMSEKALGVRIGEKFPIEVNDGVVWLTNGIIDNNCSALSNIIHFFATEHVTLIVPEKNEINGGSIDALIQTLPEKSTIIEIRDDIPQDLNSPFGLCLYIINSGLVVNKFIPWNISYWEETISILNGNNYKQEEYLEKHDYGRVITLKNKSSELIELNLSKGTILICLSPSCNLSADVIIWALEEKWPIVPVFIIYTGDISNIENYKKFSNAVNEVEFDESVYQEMIIETQILGERKKAYEVFLKDYEDVYYDDTHSLHQAFGISNFPSILLFDEDGTLAEKMFLVSSKNNSPDEDLRNPVEICWDILQ